MLVLCNFFVHMLVYDLLAGPADYENMNTALKGAINAMDKKYHVPF